MLPVSFDQASYRHPELVRQALACFAGLPAGEIAWFLVECHDDPDQPLDEAACADVMLTGTLPARFGVAAVAGEVFVCRCEQGCVSVRH